MNNIKTYCLDIRVEMFTNFLNTVDEDTNLLVSLDSNELLYDGKVNIHFIGTLLESPPENISKLSFVIPNNLLSDAIYKISEAGHELVTLIFEGLDTISPTIKLGVIPPMEYYVHETVQ